MDVNDEQKEFLQKHSIRYLEMALNYSRHEKIFRPDGYGVNTGECGDTVCMALTTMKNTIAHVSLQIDGCVNTNACANTVAYFAEGKTVDEAWEITPEKVAEYLETLPESQFHCAELAVGALYKALSDFRKKPVTRQ